MDLASCGFYLCLLFSMDVPLALASLCVFPFYIASMKTFGRRAKRTTKEVQEALADFAADDLVESTGLDNERAKHLIMAARAPWFAEASS